MRIVRQPGETGSTRDVAWSVQLDVMLYGESSRADAASWQELRDDVRALVPPMSTDFERTLGARIVQRGSDRASKHRRRRRLTTTAPSVADASTRLDPPSDPNASRSSRAKLGRLLGSGRLGVFAGTTVAVAVTIVALFLAGPLRNGGSDVKSAAPTVVASPQANAGSADAEGVTRAGPSESASAAGRVQQVAASITLAAAPTAVQATADRVSRLAESAGGFVESSHVQIQRGGPNEASLVLSLPSAKLATSLSALGRLARLRAESQSLQDITANYQASRRQLDDAVAERRALLSALTRARTEDQIDALREQLSQARAAIASARSRVREVSQRAAKAQVEVAVVGDSAGGGGGLSIDRGLRDAAKVLTVVAAVLVIALAVLIPLAIVVALAIVSRRALVRRRRERVLDLN